MPEKPTMTDAEIDAFDQHAKENFEQTLKMTQALREAWRPQDAEPKPGTPEAEAALKDAIKQGAE